MTSATLEQRCTEKHNLEFKGHITKPLEKGHQSKQKAKQKPWHSRGSDQQPWRQNA